VPEPFQPLLETMSVPERADWLEKNAEKLQGYANGDRPKGSRATGKPAGRQANQDDEENRRRAVRQTRTAFG
jgi:hypothetical protein